MKKSIKRLITVFAVCAVSAFAVVASGCNVTDKIKEKIEQARCEHEWNDGEVTKEATCIEKGELTKTCTLCEKVETEEIELAEHIAVYVQAVTPTCLEKGITDGTVCSVCETKLSGFQEIPALGHIVVKDSAVKSTCLEDGLTEGEHCSRCNEVLKAQEKVPATGHNLVILEAVEPTCTTEGKTQGVWCDKCKVVFTAQETVPIVLHADENNDVNCDACGVKMSKTINMIEVAVEAGETVAGNWYRIYYPTSTSSKVFYKLSLNNDSRTEFCAYSDDAYSQNYVFLSGPLYTLEGLEVVYGDGYIDVYLVEGTYNLLKDGQVNENGYTATIDNTTAITTFSEGYVFRLVEREV